MNVKGISPNNIINTYNKNSNNVISKGEAIKQKDRIEISELGKKLKDYSIEGEIDNSERIKEIKKQIDNGTYNVDAKLTAKKILDKIREQHSNVK